MIADGDTLVISTNQSVGAHKEYYIHFAVIPYENAFDLAVNTFKSQQGDINVAVPDASTVAVEGTYADGTEFSFGLCTK